MTSVVGIAASGNLSPANYSSANKNPFILCKFSASSSASFPFFQRNFTLSFNLLSSQRSFRRSRTLSSSFRCFSALTPELKTTIDKVVGSQKVVLFMKGTRDFPQCGFSNTVVQILKSLNVPLETVNILENELLRQALKEYSSWPTFPQLYIDGEFYGGCDITVAMRML